MKVAEDIKKAAKRGAQVGIVLAVLCHFVPPEYRAVCELIVNVCTRGGF